MSAINRTPADIAFSKCVRERSNWTCERCGVQYPEGAKGLECSHHIGRGSWSIRLDPRNAEALCTGCHFFVGGTEERMRQVMDGLSIDRLYQDKHNTQLGREYRKTKGKGPVAKHYRSELEKMKQMRLNGEMGRIEFEAWLKP